MQTQEPGGGFRESHSHSPVLRYKRENPDNYSAEGTLSGGQVISLPDSFGAVPQNVVARGAVGGGWALAGARPHGAARCMVTPKCSGTGCGWGWMGPCGCQASRRCSMHGYPKTVGERGTGNGVSPITLFFRAGGWGKRTFTWSWISVLKGRF